MTNLDSIFKSRDITLPTKVRLVKAMVFPVVTYGCESWTIKKAENWRTDAFELWCWRRLLRVPWTARRSNQSIQKEISPEYSLEGLILKLELQYFGHLMQELTHLKRPWCWERLKAGGEGDDRGWDGWMASPTQWTWVWVNPGRWWRTGRPCVLQSMGSQRVGYDWATEKQNYPLSGLTGHVILFGDTGQQHGAVKTVTVTCLHRHSWAIFKPIKSKIWKDFLKNMSHLWWSFLYFFAAQHGGS